MQRIAGRVTFTIRGALKNGDRVKMVVDDPKLSKMVSIP